MLGASSAKLSCDLGEQFQRLLGSQVLFHESLLSVKLRRRLVGLFLIRNGNDERRNLGIGHRHAVDRDGLRGVERPEDGSPRSFVIDAVNRGRGAKEGRGRRVITLRISLDAS